MIPDTFPRESNLTSFSRIFGAMTRYPKEAPFSAARVAGGPRRSLARMAGSVPSGRVANVLRFSVARPRQPTPGGLSGRSGFRSESLISAPSVYRCREWMLLLGFN